MKSDKIKILNPLVMILVILLLSSVIINVVLFGDFNGAKKVYEVSAQNYYKKLIQLQKREYNRNIEIKNEFEEYYSNNLKKLLTEENLIYLAQQQWYYLLTVNGENFNNSLMYTKDNNIKIVLSEFHSKEKSLPEDILVKGTLTGGDSKDKLQSHMKVISPVDALIYVEEDEYGKRICYEIQNIPKGSLITLQLSEMLKYRMKLQDKLKANEMEIVVR